MIIAEAFALSVLIAIIRGGRLSRIAEVDLGRLWLAYMPLLIQVAVFSYEPLRIAMIDYVPYIHVLTYVLSGLFAFSNLRVPGMKLMCGGLASNALVIAANGGYMPASTSALTGAGMIPVLKALAGGPYHNSILIHGGTPFWFLADIFYVPASLPAANVFSPGDALISLGAFLFAQKCMVSQKTLLKSPSRNPPKEETPPV